MTDNDSAHASVKTYLLVFGGLAVLTAMTLTLSYVAMPHGTAVLAAALIAAAKCTLIATFFMHLKWERRSLLYVLFTALFFVVVLVAALIGDIGLLK